MPNDVVSNRPLQQKSRRHLWRWLFLIVLGALVWNGRLLWSISKPVLLAQPNEITVQASATSDPLPDEFRYPRLGIDAPLHANPSSSPLHSQDWAQISEDLKHGVSLAFDTPSFDQAPYAYVTGHSSDVYPHPYSSVFAALGQAKLGDLFALVVDNHVYSYKVSEIRLAYPTDLPAFQIQNADAAHQHVLLVTCWPLLTTTERKIVIGERI